MDWVCNFVPKYVFNLTHAITIAIYLYEWRIIGICNKYSDPCLLRDSVSTK
jgi:hypothetical protein